MKLSIRRATISTGDLHTEGYRGIKRTSPEILDLARHAIFFQLSYQIEEGELTELAAYDHLDLCIAKLAGWPEAMTITYLLRDMDPDRFYNA